MAKDLLGQWQDDLAEQPGWTYGSILPLATDPQGGYHAALPGMLRSNLKGVLDLLQGPSTGVMTPEATMALGLLGGAAGQEFGQPGALGVFAGTKAKGAPTENLLKFQGMENAGKTPQEIWKETGWFRGQDNQLKWEIPDANAMLTISGMDRIRSGETPPLGEVLRHPQLFENYPDLANVPVGRSPSTGAQGTHFPETASGYESIQLATNRFRRDIQPTLLHEVQHAIQKREGFGYGGAPDYRSTENIQSVLGETEDAAGLLGVIRDMTGLKPGTPISDAFLNKDKYDLLDQARAKLAETLGREPKYNGWISGITSNPDRVEHDLLNIRNEYMDKLHSYNDWNNQAFSNYQQLPGEAEARAVAARSDMHPTLTKVTHPFASYDEPGQNSLTRTGLDLRPASPDAGAASAAPPPGATGGGMLDLSTEARLARARAMGFNTDRVVYHGSPSPDIEAFNPDLLGVSTKAPSAKKGFFFAADPDTAHAYGKDMMDYSNPEFLARRADLEGQRDALNKQVAAHYYANTAAQGYQKLKDKMYEMLDVIDKTRNEGKKAQLWNDYNALSKQINQAASSQEYKDFIGVTTPLEMQAHALDGELKNLQPPWRKDLTIYPSYLKYNNPLEYDFKGDSYREVTYNDLLTKAKRGRRDAVILRNTYDSGPKTDIHVVFKPNQIRSIFADFDPAKADSGDILSATGPASLGLLGAVPKAGMSWEDYKKGGRT